LIGSGLHATALRCWTDLSHSAIRFQLAKMRLAILDRITRHDLSGYLIAALHWHDAVCLVACEKPPVRRGRLLHLTA